MLLCMFSIVCSFTDCISATLNLPLFVGRVRVACLMMPQTHLSVQGNTIENDYNVSSIESIIRLNYRDMGGDI